MTSEWVRAIMSERGDVCSSITASRYKLLSLRIVRECADVVVVLLPLPLLLVVVILPEQ